MNKMNRKNIFLAMIFAIFALFFTSCYEPSPLYGTWADNNGNSVSFMSDGSFVATIYDTVGDSTIYQGTYSVVENILVFSYSVEETKKSYSMNTEWDIRGSMLYCTWTISDNETKKLTLYHTAK